MSDLLFRKSLEFSNIIVVSRHFLRMVILYGKAGRGLVSFVTELEHWHIVHYSAL